jgi:hypothetical protein
MENLLRTHVDRFNNIRPILDQISTLTLAFFPSGSNAKVLALERKILALEHQLATNERNFSFLESLSAMQEEIRLLQQRIVRTGISIGSQVFQSYEDFVIWVKSTYPQANSACLSMVIRC